MSRTQKYCFLVSTEASNYFYNQLKFLLYSFRKYAGTLKDSFFYICVNNGGLEDNKVKFLEDNFAPLKIVQKKYTGLGNCFARRYNMFQHFDMLDEFDTFIAMDCDIMIGSDFSNILKLDDGPSFKGVPAAAYGYNIRNKYGGHAKVLEHQFDFTKTSIDRVKSDWHVKKTKVSDAINKDGDLPHFNGGFWVIDEHGFKNIRKHIQSYLKKSFIFVNGGVIKTSNQGNYEQIALTMLVIKEIETYGILDVDYSGPQIYHNFKGICGKLHYKEPGHVDIKKKYPQSKLREHRYISKIITEFINQYGDVEFE
jgi:hypothetical protein